MDFAVKVGPVRLLKSKKAWWRGFLQKVATRLETT